MVAFKFCKRPFSRSFYRFIFNNINRIRLFLVINVLEFTGEDGFFFFGTDYFFTF